MRVAALGEFGASGLVVCGHEWQIDAGFTVPSSPNFLNRAAFTDGYVERLALVRDLVRP